MNQLAFLIVLGDAPILPDHQHLSEGNRRADGIRVRRDKQGLLYFVGRADGMIKTAGNRVSPTEIEEASLASGLVAEAVALGYPDPLLGQGIALVARPLGEPDEAKLRSHLKRALPNFMQPGAIVWRQELPRSPNGKIDRAVLEQELTA
jgi:acyl-coenzyme A synthetase/AMP-(fatty) acid ligase